ncbi:MAG: hypothetical protein ACI4QI_07635 [Candidatus Coproplasma sp.]
MPDFYLEIIRDSVNNYQTILELKYVKDMQMVHEVLAEARACFENINEVLDQYKIDEDLRFDLDDLLYCAKLYRTLYIFDKEERCSQIAERIRTKSREKRNKPDN